MADDADIRNVSPDFTASEYHDDGVCFFSSGEGEFGWAEFKTGDEDDDEDDRRGVFLAAAETRQGDRRAKSAVGSSAINMSVSSSSSEDPPEKSTGSGGKSPPEIPNKAKTKGEKQIRQPRFAFMTKSDVDNLEDGYRWRKYGQKAVKNSPFPRSYYRCTNSKCTVKKRVERSSEDVSIVITTYEGQHCHLTAGFPRGGAVPRPDYPMALFPGTSPVGPESYGHQFLRRPSLLNDNNVGDRANVAQSSDQSVVPRQEGLLGDIVPPGMR